MPTSQYVYVDPHTDPDETVLDIDETLLEDSPAKEPKDTATDYRPPAVASPQFTQPLPLRGGAFNLTSQSSASTQPSTVKRSKKARLRALAEMMDSDESDEELSEQVG
jgi:hypothetical protein